MRLPYPKAVISSILFSALTFCTARAQQWNVLGTADFSAGGAEMPAMVLNAAGNPYVAYKDGANGQAATVMAYSGSGWTSVGNPGFSNGIASFVNIALDKNGVPYVVYANQNYDNAASVMTYNGSAWTLLDTLATDILTTFTDIAIDTPGHPYIVYVDGRNDFKACVKRYNGTSWQYVGNADFSAGEVTNTTIALNKGGTPYVAFQDAASNYKASVMAFNGSSWGYVGQQGFSAGRVTTPDLVLDTNGVPYVVFADVAHENKATVMTFNGTSWVNVGIPGFSDTSVNYTSIAIGGNNLPYVSFSDGDTGVMGGPVTVMEYTGTDWMVMCANGISPGPAAYTTVAVAPKEGMYYVSYMDLHDDNKVTVLSNNGYTPCFGAGIPNVSAGSDFSIYPNPASEELSVVSAADRIMQLTVSNIVGQTVYSVKPDALAAQVPVSSLPSGVYFVKVNNAEVKKFVKQ